MAWQVLPTCPLKTACSSPCLSFASLRGAHVFYPRKKRAAVVALAGRDDSEGFSVKEDKQAQTLWRDELARQPSAWSDEAFLSQSLEEDMQESLPRQNRAASGAADADSTMDSKGFVASLVEKLLVADFFFILFILAWFLLGLAEKAALDTSSLFDSWLPLWPVVFQPALGFFMAGAIWTALSKFLSKK